MSGFFKVREQAKLEHALRAQAGRPEDDAPLAVANTPAAGQPVPRQDIPSGVEEHLVSLLTPNAFETEPYRTLCYHLEQMHKDAGLHTVAVTSPALGDGKTTTAINLAGALAQAPEARILLVETDLRRPSMSERLGLEGSGNPGLVEVILDLALSLEDAVRLCPPFNLAVLPAGRYPAVPYEVFKSQRFGALLEQARRLYDYIVLDTPPLIPFLDCKLIEPWIDGFLVVVAAHKTPRKLLAAALNILEPTKIVGLVFNGDNRLVSRYYSVSDTHRNGGAARSNRTERKSRGFLRR